jgi:hypothetical protein
MVVLWHCHVCLQCTLVAFIPTTILPHPPPPEKQFLQDTMFFFSYKHVKYIDFSIPLSTLTSTCPWTGRVLHSCPVLFKCIFIVHRGFTLWTWIRLRASLTLPYQFSPILYYSMEFSVICHPFLLVLCYCLFLSLLSLLPWNSSTIVNMNSPPMYRQTDR